jgi:hypothetical protein
MARKPPSWRQRLLFPSDPSDSPEPQGQVVSHPEGSEHAVQDDHSGTSSTTTGDAQPTPEEPEAAADRGTLRQGAEDQPRSLEGSPLTDETGQRPDPDRERGAGDGPQGSGGSFALRVSSERNRTVFSRSRNGFHQSSYAARVRASRGQPSLFDDLPQLEPAVAESEPAEPKEIPQPAGATGPASPDAGKPSEQHAAPSDNAPPSTSLIASGEKAKARDILVAIRIVKRIEHEQRPATPEEKQALARFAGFGPVALSIFPDPATGRYKDASWQSVGEELKSLLTPAEYDSAKRTTFNAFYTSPTVIAAIHEAIARLGIPGNATVLEPGCGTGNFMSHGQQGTRFIGVELDRISGRIAR